MRTQYVEHTNILGNIAIEQYALEQRKQMLEAEKQSKLQQIEQLKQQEAELIVKLRERYGEGEINIEQGTFTEQQPV
jgi:hypothetical protein